MNDDQFEIDRRTIQNLTEKLLSMGLVKSFPRILKQGVTTREVSCIVPSA